MDASCLDTCAPSRTQHLRGLDCDCRGNSAFILLLSSPPPHGVLQIVGRGRMLLPREGDGGVGATTPTSPQC